MLVFIAKTLDLIRPFLAMAELIQVSLCSPGLTKTLDFIRPFLAMAELMQASLCPPGLTKTLQKYRILTIVPNNNTK
jgi:hypothetical protein